MSKERELLSRVLEADDGNSEFYIDGKLEWDIKELLAQPEQEPVAWMQDDIELYVQEEKDIVRGYVIPLYTSPPEQEPVAWIIQTEIEGKLSEWVCTDKKHYMDEHDAIKDPIPLYTAPPTREPFGPEERQRLSRAYSTQAEQVAFEEGIIFAEISYGIGGGE